MITTKYQWINSIKKLRAFRQIDSSLRVSSTVKQNRKEGTREDGTVSRPRSTRAMPLPVNEYTPEREGINTRRGGDYHDIALHHHPHPQPRTMSHNYMYLNA